MRFLIIITNLIVLGGNFGFGTGEWTNCTMPEGNPRGEDYVSPKLQVWRNNAHSPDPSSSSKNGRERILAPDRLHHPHGKIFMGIAFDVTQTMSRELDNFKESIPKLLAYLENLVGPHSMEFVWVGFTDKEAVPAAISTDALGLVKILENIVPANVTTKDGCAKNVLGGLNELLKKARPGSNVYVFTDSLPMSSAEFNEVLSQIMKKKIKVYFVKTEGCQKESQINLWLVTYLARVSSGQVYASTKDQFYRVLKYVGRENHPDAVSLASVNRQSTAAEIADAFEVLIDDSMSEFTVSLASLGGSLEILDPTDDHALVLVENPTDSIKKKELLNLPNSKVIKVLSPKSGKWTVLVRSSSPYMMRVTSISKIHFDYELSPPPPFKLAPEKTHDGTNFFITVDTFNSNPRGKFTELRILGMGGEKLMNLKLSEVPNKKGTYTTLVNLPSEQFLLLQVKGFDEKGMTVARLSNTGVLPDTYQKPVVHLADKMTALLYEKIMIKCEVVSSTPLTVKWFRNGNRQIGIQECRKTCTSTLSISKVTLKTAGNYTCQATNEAGTASKTMQIIVGRLPKVQTSHEVYAERDQEVTLKCRVRSETPYTVTWARVINDDKSEIEISLPKGSTVSSTDLSISRVTSDVLGKYVCSAQNAAGHSRSEVFLDLGEPVVVEIDAHSIDFMTGNCLKFTCTVGGKPKPEITWLKNGKPIEDDSTEIWMGKRNLTLKISPANENHAGVYTCMGSNKYDVEISSVKLHHHFLRISGEPTHRC